MNMRNKLEDKIKEMLCEVGVENFLRVYGQILKYVPGGQDLGKETFDYIVNHSKLVKAIDCAAKQEKLMKKSNLTESEEKKVKELDKEINDYAIEIERDIKIFLKKLHLMK